MKKVLVNLKDGLSIKLNGISIMELIMTIIGVLFIGYFGLSFIDVISNNLGSCSYQSWNIFNIMIKLSGK